MSLNLYAISSIFVTTTCFAMTILSFVKGRRKKQDYIWILFCLMATIWGVGGFGFSTSKTYEKAYFYWQIANICTIFAPTFYSHFIFNLLELKKKRFLFFLYGSSIFFIGLVFFFPKIFLGDLRFVFNEFYIVSWPARKNVLYISFYVFYYWVLLFYDWQLLMQSYRHESGIKREQIKYIMLGSLFGWVGGHGIFPAVFGFNIYPFSNFLIGIYPLIITYAIIRYRLLDIKIAITRAGIFLFVYTLVLGIPFWLGWKMLGFGIWLIPMITGIFLTSFGQGTYSFLKRQAEAQILKEERTILEILKKAAREIPHIKDIPHLLKFITNNLQKLSVNYVAIYLWDVESNSYNLKDSVPVQANVLTVAKDDSLIFELREKKMDRLVNYLNRDEIQFGIKDSNHLKSQKIIVTMESLSAQVIIPMIFDGALLGFIVLGKREERKAYSEESLGVLSSIGSLAGNSIADYFYWEKMGLQERRASLDHMADSVAHEIDNPITVIRMQNEGSKETLQDSRISMPDELRQRLNKAIYYIDEACTRVSKMVKDVKDYSKGTSGEKSPIRINAVEESYWSLMGPVFKKESIEHKIEYIREIDSDLPYILADKIKLEQVLTNFANNSLHAVRNSNIKKIKLRIYKKNDDWIRLEYFDTGYGIEKDMIEDIWLAHVTTKGSVEGSGLGLFVIRKIIDDHGGRAWAESEGKGKGATMIVELPVFKGEIKEQLIEEKPKKGPKTMY